MNRVIREAYACLWTGTHAKPARLCGMLVCPQFNNWSCGPMAIRFCLMKWRHDVGPTTISELARSTRAGTGELNMQLACYRLGYRWRPRNELTLKSSKELIHRELGRGRPLVLCVENWTHWIAVLHHSNRGYLIFDSSRPGPVIQLHGWKWLKRRLRYVSSSTRRPVYSIASLSPQPVQHRQ